MHPSRDLMHCKKAICVCCRPTGGNHHEQSDRRASRNILLTPKTEWPVIAAEPETTSGLYKGYILILVGDRADRDVHLKSTLIGTSAVPRHLPRGHGTGLTTLDADATCLGLVAVWLFVADRQRARADVRRAEGSGAGAEGRGLCDDRGLDRRRRGDHSVCSAWLIDARGRRLQRVPALPRLARDDEGARRTRRSATPRSASSSPIAFPGCRHDRRRSSIGGSMSWAGDGGPAVTRRGRPLRGRQPGAAASRNGREKSKRPASASRQSENAQGVPSSRRNRRSSSARWSAPTPRRRRCPPDEIKAFLPATLAGLPRTALSSERNSAMGIQVSEANAGLRRWRRAGTCGCR